MYIQHYKLMHSIDANIWLCQPEKDYIKLSGRSDKIDVNQVDLNQAIFNKQQLILATSRICKNLLQLVSANQRRPFLAVVKQTIKF